MKKLRILNGCLTAFIMIFNMAVGVPIAKADGDLTFEVNFGEKLTSQEINGYQELSGNNIERFYQAVEELPDEVPVIKPFTIGGENVFYVSTGGNDSNDGLSKQNSLKTIEKALEKVKNLSADQKENGTVIYLANGDYIISETVQINSEHCSENSPLFIASYGGKANVFTSKSFNISDMTAVNEDNTDFSDHIRIHPSAKNNLYFIEYKDLGIAEISVDDCVLFGDEQLKIARYPNAGFDSISEVINGGYGKNCTWVPVEKRAFSWLDTGNIYVKGKFSLEWDFSESRIRIDNEAEQLQGTGALSTSTYPISKSLFGGGVPEYFYYNIFEELDVQGEWYADNTNKRLYLYPLNMDSQEYRICNNNTNIFEISDAKNIVFDGVAISGGNRGISITESENVIIQNCFIKNTASEAVYMYNTEKCGVISSEIFGGADTKRTVVISESDEKRTDLIPRRNFVQNNIICNGENAILFIGTGGIISHNLIQNTDNSAIVFKGAENIIEYNEISGTQKMVSDSGAIYTGTNFTIRNNHIRYNYIHDCGHNNYDSRGIYIDDCNDNEYIYGNIVENYSHGIFIHGGDNHIIKDNLVINVDEPIGNAYDYAINGSHGTQMQDAYFVKCNVLSDYEEFGYGNSVTWKNRYNTSLETEYNSIQSAKTLFKNLGIESQAVTKIKNVVTNKVRFPSLSYQYVYGYSDVKSCIDVVVDHGCYYLNNTALNCSSEAKYATDAGMNNFEENNKDVTGSRDVYLSDITYYNKIGTINPFDLDFKDSFLFAADGMEIFESDFNGFSWTGSDVANYYNVQIATDEGFSSIVIDTNVLSTEFSLYQHLYNSDGDTVERVKNYNYNDDMTGDTDFVKNKTYYLKVRPINISNSIRSENVDVITGEFSIIENEEKETVYSLMKGNVSNYMLIEGSVPYYLSDKEKAVNLLIYDADYKKEELLTNPKAIKQIIQLAIDNKNKFSYRFKINDEDYQNLNVMVRIAGEELREDSFEAMVSTFTEIIFDTSLNKTVDGEMIAQAVASVNNRFNLINDYTVIIAEYGQNNKLINCEYKDFVTADNSVGEIEYMVQDESNVLKAFVWQNMKPLTGEVNIN